MLCNSNELQTWIGGDRKLAILDLRSPAEYEAGHIPGAVNIDVRSYHPIIRSEEQRAEATRFLVDLFRSCGVDNDSTVILYQAFTGWASCRAYWMLEYLGQRPNFVLDGGYRNWIDSGGASETEVRPLPGAGNLSPAPRRRLLATADYISSRVGDPDVQIIDMRTIAEYDGTDDRDNPRHGHIPGAIWMNWEMLIGPDGTMRDAKEVAAEFAQRDVQPDKEVIVYCNGGARSACGFIALHQAGHQNFRNYFGSWHEWSRQYDLPIEQPVYVAK